MFAPLADRRFRHLFAAQTIALFGTGLTTVALSLLAFDLAGGDAGAVLGTALALKMIAYVTIAPVAGAVAHRLDRRRLLVALDLARAGIVLALPFVTAVWQVYLLIFLVNACSAAFTPVFQASIPDVLQDEERYTQALSLSRLAYELENLLSPAAAALALLAISYDGLFLANAAAFAASALLVATTRLPAARPPERAGGIAENLLFGMRIYLRTPRLRALLALAVAVAAGGAMTIVNTVVIVRDRLGGSDSDTAIAFAAAGAGAMAAALALPRLLRRLPERPVMLAGGAAMGLGLLAGLLQPGLSGLLAIWLLLGAGSALVQTPAGRLLRRSSTEGDRPALFAAQFALSHLCWLATYPLAGWAGKVLGLEAAFAILAALCLAATATALRLWPSPDPQVLAHSHEAQDHAHLHVHDDQHHRHAHEGWEGPEPHSHPHRHAAGRHAHAFVVDLHHPAWPQR
ncbi:MFS transporter [Marinibaculum pumilum]|uniref:Multidrug efflux pump Tap n=1 Tax=Marinibaculum pumilum TaxID=1766165 RepID=A0ABV7L2P1_9PROT